jgi:glutamate--cysteine ligase
MHCLLSDSPPDSPEEIHELAHNQHQTAARGREPGLRLQREGQPVVLQDWGLEIIDQLGPIAARLDRLQGGSAHAHSVAQARAALLTPETLPSARVLAAVQTDHKDSFVAFARDRSQHIRRELLALPWSDDQQSRYVAMAVRSMAEQQAIEAADSLPFEIYRQEYVSEKRLGRAHPSRAQALAAQTAVTS